MEMMEKESNLVTATLTFSWCFFSMASRSSQSWDSRAVCSFWILSPSLVRVEDQPAPGVVPYPTDRIDKAWLGRQMGETGQSLLERKRLEIMSVAVDRCSGWHNVR